MNVKVADAWVTIPEISLEQEDEGMKIEVGKHYIYKRRVVIDGIAKEVCDLVKVIEKPDAFTATVLLIGGYTIDVSTTSLHEEEVVPSKPTHYDTAIDTIEFAKANFSREQVEGFMRINAIKYLQRVGEGEKLSDLRKAAHYVSMLIGMEEAE